MQIPLLTGAYTARSVIASAQRCLNLYPETNPTETMQGLPQPVAATLLTHYPTPGTVLMAAPPAPGVGRGLYRASNGNLYAVINNTVYFINQNWIWFRLGFIQEGSTPVSFADNAVTAVLVDGSPNGYQIDIASNTFSTIVDDTGLFSGADRVDYIDGYFVFNKPGTPQFYCSLAQEVAFDPNYWANKNGAGDNLVSIIVCQRNIWLIGELTTEIWYDAGNSDFPFQINPANFIQHGCAAKFSVAMQDGNIFWLSRDPQGQGIVYAAGSTTSYTTQRVSTFCIENEIAKYERIDDAIGFTYQQLGHTFYVLTFPTADRTWVLDVTNGLWHERGVFDTEGVQHRIRANGHAFAYGKNLVIDFESGDIIELDPNTYTDMGQPVPRERTFPHMVSELKRITYWRFIADMEAGNSQVPDDTNGGEKPTVLLSWSDDRGASYGNEIAQTLGTQGSRLATLTWNRLGMARDRVFKLQWSSASRTALNGAFVEVEASAS